MQILIVIILIGVVIFLAVKLNTEKAYYKYQTDELDKVETNTSKKIKEL